MTESGSRKLATAADASVSPISRRAPDYHCDIHCSSGFLSLYFHLTRWLEWGEFTKMRASRAFLKPAARLMDMHVTGRHLFVCGSFTSDFMRLNQCTFGTRVEEP